MNETIITIISIVIAMFLLYLLLKTIFEFLKKLFEEIPPVAGKLLLLVAVAASIYVFFNPEIAIDKIKTVVFKEQQLQQNSPKTKWVNNRNNRSL